MSQDSLTNGEQVQNIDDNHSNNINRNKIERPPSSSTTTNSKFSSKMSTMKSGLGLRSLALDEHIKLVKQKKEEAEILRLQKFQEQLKKKEQKWQQQQLERVKKWLQLRNRDNDHRSQVEERRRKREEEAKAKIDELLRREKEREQRVQHTKTNHSQKPDIIMTMSTDIPPTRRAISASRLRSNQRLLTDSSDDNPNSFINSHQLNPIDERQSHRQKDSLPGIQQSSTHNQTALYWSNTGDNNNTTNHFMRSTYAAKSRSHHSHSHDRCPRVRRARDEINNPSTLPNGDSHRRLINTNRQHLTETVRRTTRPKNNSMTQSVHIGTSSNGIPMSRSSHQIRMPTPPVAPTRRNVASRPATVPTSHNPSRTSPSDDSSSSRSKQPSSSTKPPTFSSSSRSKPSTQRSRMTTSHSSSSISSSTTMNKRRIGATSPTKSKPSPPPALPVPSAPPSVESEPILNTNEAEIEEENVPVIEEITVSLVEIIPEVNNNTNSIKREQQQQPIDEQEYQRKLTQKIREAQQRLELERQREEEERRRLELEEYEREQEQIRLVEEQHRLEQERLQRAIEERERENELKRQEEQRLQQQREELERKQAEESERLNRERQERARKEEEERLERKKRLDLIMRRTRQVSPTSKQENNANKPTINQTNGHEQTNNGSSPTIMTKSSIPHSISDNRFPSSSSTDNFLHNNNNNNDLVASPMISSTTDAPKFKSPLIQSLLNKARNTRSTDNLIQTSMTASQIMTESMVDETRTAAKSTISTDLSDDDHQENSNTNGHTDIHSSITSSYHDRPIEAATAFQ